MTPILFNQQDPYFKGAGPVEVILLDPRVKIQTSASPNAVYNPSFDQKDYAYPPGTGRVVALQLDATDEDHPTLIPLIIPAAISSVFNLVTNSNTEGFVPVMPRPLVPLTGKQAIVRVHISASIIQYDAWWVVQDGTMKPQPGPNPNPSPAGGSYTDADRKQANDMYVLLMKLAEVNGVR